MTSPEEEQRKKSAEAKAKEPEKPSEPRNDALGFVGQLVGDVRNQATDAVLGTHSGEKVLSGITPQLALQYKHGQEIQERLASGELKQNQLTEADRKNLDAFNNVRKTISQVPMYDQDSLMRYVEKGIEQKAKAAPPETSKTTPARETSIKEEAGKTAGPAVAKESGDAKKATTQSAQPARKEVPGSSTAPPDSKSAGPSPAQLPHPGETHPAEAKNTINKAQSEPVSAGSFREAKTDSQRSVKSAVHRELPVAQESAPHAVDVTKVPVPEPHLQTERIQKESSQPQERPKHFESGIQAPKEEKQAALNNKSFISNTNAAGAFERRTAYDARTQQEVKHQMSGGNAESQSARSNLPTDVQTAKAKISLESQKYAAGKQDTVAGSSIHYSGAFANMRRVLEERTSMTGSLPQRSRLFEQQQTKPQTQMETREALQRNSGTERRATLTDFRINLSSQRLEQIARISAERFPAGLRWLNTPGHADAAVAGTRMHSRGDSHADAATIKHVDANSVKANESAHAITPESQPGIIRNVQSGTVRDSQSSPVRDGQSGASRDQQIGSVGSNQSGLAASTEGKSFSISGRLENRYITGAEIALAAVIAAAGAKRVRLDQTNQPAMEIATTIPRVQKIDAFLPSQSKSEKVLPGARVHTVAQSKPDGIKDSVPKVEGVKVEPSRSDIRSESRQTESKSDRIKPTTFTSTFNASEKRFLTGAEIALAAVIASCGSARIRQSLVDKVPELIAQTDTLNLTDPQEFTSAEGPGEDKRDIRTSRAESQTKDGSTFDEDDSDDDVPGTLRYLQKHKYNRQTILIGPGDTLVSIADAVWENRNLGWLIADINMHRIKETFIDGKRIVEVRSRQLLELPGAKDIDAFCRHRKEEYKPENLVTIVIETQIDRELLNEHLGVFVEGNTPVSPGARANPSFLSRTTFGADGSALLPALTLESAGILKVATYRLMKLTGNALAGGRKRFSKLKDALQSDKIKRRM